MASFSDSQFTCDGLSLTTHQQKAQRTADAFNTNISRQPKD